MAAETVNRSATNTLSSTTADAITFDQAWPAYEITNYGATRISVTVTDAAVAPTLDVNNGLTVPAGATKTIHATGRVVNVVGDGNVYSVAGVN